MRSISESAVVESALARSRALQVEDGVYRGSIQSLNQAFRAAQRDSRFEWIVRVDLHAGRRILKFQRHGHGKFDKLLAALALPVL